MNGNTLVVTTAKNVKKYTRPIRLPLGKIDFSKRYMDREAMYDILNVGAVVEEKMDGKHTKSVRNPFVFFSEDLLVRKRVAYRVPGRFAIFDIFDKEKGLFLAPDEKMELVKITLG